MPRLFGKEYHEHSNTWYFHSTVRNFQKNDITYTTYRDEKGYTVFTFRAVPSFEQKFSAKVKIIYDTDEQKIVKHECNRCRKEDTCSHYLSIINYGYKYLDTEILEEKIIQTYQNKLLRYNEYWQRIIINSFIAVEGIYDTTDKIRIYFRNYKPIDIRLVSFIVSGRPIKEADQKMLPAVHKQVQAFSNEELELLVTLQSYKCSFSRVGHFFTIYKKDFCKVIPVLKSIQDKVYIKETGDRLEFSDEKAQISFIVDKTESDSYIVKLRQKEIVSAFFVDKTTYIFRKNKVFQIQLPFTREVTETVLNEEYKFNEEDLIYFATVVARQLAMIKCYIDFTEGIELPEFFDNTPRITFKLHREADLLYLKGNLDFSDDVSIPLSSLVFQTELIRYDQHGVQTWFYIPPQIKYEISNFLKLLPESETRSDSDAQLVFEGEERIDHLKKVLFEHADPSWNIVLSDDLKKEFIYKVELSPQIKAKSSAQIDWFEYEVTYKFKDITFTHEELRKFFKKKEKFLKLEDGRLLFFTNEKAFEDVETLLKKSVKDTSESYKLSLYNIPYIYQLNSINDNMQMNGDTYLDQMYSNIISRKLNDSTEVMPVFKPVMRSYQKAGYNWLKMLQKYHFGGILADDMGLGKTLQAISVLAEIEQGKTAIVICPKTLLYNWAAEIEKFAPGMKYLIYEGGKEERIKLLEEKGIGVLIASYSIIVNDINDLKEREFEYIILDEAQHIKNSMTKRSKAIKSLRGNYKLALTGTPMENSPVELWSIFDFLLPGYLDGLRKFKQEYVTPLENKAEQEKHLSAIISPFILRRKKKDVLIELPDKQEQVVYCGMSEIQEKMYMQVLETVRNQLFNTEGPEKTNYIHILAALTRLRQISNHPVLFTKDVKSNLNVSAKMDTLMEIVIEANLNRRKIIIFSQFVEMLKLIRSQLKKHRIVFEYMDGDTKNRKKRIDNFNENSQVKVFLISLKTGGVGINLTSADTVILTDPWWNPMGENQAIDRAHRIGQTKKVMVYKLITKKTVEEKILQLQKNKIEMFENIIDNGQNIIKQMDMEELRNLFEY